MTSQPVPFEPEPSEFGQPIIPDVEQVEAVDIEQSELSRRQRIGQWIGNTRAMQWFANTRPGKLAGVGMEDLREGSIGQRIGLLATAVLVAYEWGPGNEAVTPFIGSQVLAHTDGLTSVIATSAITGGFTAVEQIAAGSAAAYTISTFPRLAKTTFELYNEGETDRDAWKDTPFKKRWAYAFGIGSTFAVTREAAVTGDVEQGHLTRTAASSAAISSGTVAVVGAAAGSLKLIPEDAPEYVTWVTDKVLTGIESPLTWLSLAAFYIASPVIRKRFAKRTQNPVEATADAEVPTNEKDD